MAGNDLLNDRAIRAALKHAQTSGQVAKLPDGGGLRLDVQPSGVGWWRIRYRLEGREQMLSLGVYPDVTLAEARQRRTEVRALVAKGENPSLAKKATRQAAAAAAETARLVDAGKPAPGTFEAVARDWIDKVHRSKTSDGHAVRTLRRFELNAFPWIGARPLTSIEPPDLLAVVTRVTERGAIETAHRLKDACGQVFRYGISAGLCTRNPAADLRGALPAVLKKHRAAIVDPKRAAELLQAMGGYVGHPITRAALALSALLFLRPGELRCLEWAWLDLDEAMLTVPAAAMKRTKQGKATGAPHLVPLAPQAVAIFRDLQPLTGGGGYVFPSLQTAGRCMSENTVNVALRRMGFDRETATAHGFRAMARTMAAERLGIDPQVIEAQLAHTVPDALGRAYNRTQFVDQRRALMTRWADYLDELRRGVPAAQPA